MASINTDAVNLKQMRQHRERKMLTQELPSQEETDLFMCSSVVDTRKSIALNARPEFATLETVLQANPANEALVSNIDHELMIKIAFKDPVTATSISFRAEQGVDSLECSGPCRIHCFANLEDLDFVDVESATPAQTLELTRESLNGEKLPLKGNRFSRCTSIQLWIQTNQDETEHTFLNRLCLLGRVSPFYNVH